MSQPKSDKYTHVIDTRNFADPNLAPKIAKNVGTSILYFECTLAQNGYIDLLTDYLKNFPRVLILKPGETKILPHQYFNVNTRDGSPCKIAWADGIEIDRKQSRFDGLN